jgi:hypothetical protein
MSLDILYVFIVSVTVLASIVLVVECVVDSKKKQYKKMYEDTEE